MERDTLFQEEFSGPFTFDKAVSHIFDDMALRSIPGYQENLRISQEIISHLCPKGSLIVDLGCSTGNALSHIIQKNGSQFYTLIGVDQSSEMLDQAKKKFLNLNLNIFENDISWLCLDISNPQNLDRFSSCQCFLLRYTLQFIELSTRKNLLIKLRNLCAPNGFLLINEKISNEENSPLLLDHWYHQFKIRNGYSPIEIQRKKIALQNILVPLTLNQNIDLFKSAGFLNIQTVFQWYNFVTFFVSTS